MAEREQYPSKLNSTTLVIDRTVHEALRAASFHTGRTGRAITHEALVEWLARHGQELPAGWELRGRRVVEVEP